MAGRIKKLAKVPAKAAEVMFHDLVRPISIPKNEQTSVKWANRAVIPDPRQIFEHAFLFRNKVSSFLYLLIYIMVGLGPSWNLRRRCFGNGRTPTL